MKKKMSKEEREAAMKIRNDLLKALTFHSYIFESNEFFQKEANEYLRKKTEKAIQDLNDMLGL